MPERLITGILLNYKRYGLFPIKDLPSVNNKNKIPNHKFQTNKFKVESLRLKVFIFFI